MRSHRCCLPPRISSNFGVSGVAFPNDRGRHSFPRIKESWGEFSSRCASPFPLNESTRSIAKNSCERLDSATGAKTILCFSFSRKIGWNVREEAEKKNGEKVGRKRTCGGRAREKVRQRGGERVGKRLIG